MKTCFLFTLVGFVTGFSAPVFAEKQSTVAPEVRQQIEALIKSPDFALTAIENGKESRDMIFSALHCAALRAHCATVAQFVAPGQV